MGDAMITGLFFACGVIVTTVFVYLRNRKPHAYYRLAVGGQYLDSILYSRQRAVDKAKEVAQRVPNIPVEIWGLELLGRAMVSVSKPYHWEVGKIVSTHWPEITILDETKGTSNAVDTLSGTDAQTEARSADPPSVS